MARRHPNNSFQRQAADLTLVRYGPELSALTTLLRQAQQDRNQTIRTARSTAGLIQSSVDQARPDVRHVYTAAGRTAAKAQRIAAPALAGLPAGSPFAAAAALEQSGLKGRLAESRAASLSDLDRRRVAAGEGAAYAQQAARREYSQTRGQIGQRAQDLSREEGAFAASTMMDLIAQRAQSRQEANRLAAQLTNSRGNALISAGLMPRFDKHGNLIGAAPIPGGRLDPNAPQNQPKPAKPQPWASQPQQSKAGDTIHAALTEAQTLKHAGWTRQEALNDILNGVPDRPGKPIYRTIKTPGKPDRQVRVLNPDGTPKMTQPVPGIKAINEQLYVQAALDLAYEGHLSRRTQNLLRARRVRIGPLGVTTYGQWLKRLRAALAAGKPPPNYNAAVHAGVVAGPAAP